MSNNGNKEQIKKLCPFNGKWCLGDACTLYVELTTTQVGQLGVPMMSKQGMCAFLATLSMLSILTIKGQPQSMRIPPLVRK